MTKMIDKLKKINLFSKTLSRIKKKNRFIHLFAHCVQELVPSEGILFYQLDESKKNLEFGFFHYYKEKLYVPRMQNEFCPFADIPMFVNNYKNIKNPLVNALFQQKILTKELDSLEEDMEQNIWQQLQENFGLIVNAQMICPMIGEDHDKLGVFVLLNSNLSSTEEDKEVMRFFSTLSMSFLDNQAQNYDLKMLFESFVRILAKAIDDKSPYTGGHCRRVPDLTMMIADALNQVDYGVFQDYHLSPERRYELELAALLHDCGKITTPTHIMDKATKLQTIFDRIELLADRFEVIKRDREIQFLQQSLQDAERAMRSDKVAHYQEKKQLRAKRMQRQKREIQRDYKFLKHMNYGQERVDEHLKNRVKRISHRYRYKNVLGSIVNFLKEDEFRNLTISRGTLLPEERQIINHHIDVTIDMLEEMHFPKHLKNIPEFAGGHHEKMDGTGYPKHLKREEMSIEARIMGVADIFEALTAIDRPYKRGKLLSETLKIMGKMKEKAAIDSDIFEVFIDQKVYLQYAKKHLEKYQIDEVNDWDIPGYTPLAKRSNNLKKIAS